MDWRNRLPREGNEEGSLRDRQVPMEPMLIVPGEGYLYSPEAKCLWGWQKRWELLKPAGGMWAKRWGWRAGQALRPTGHRGAQMAGCRGDKHVNHGSHGNPRTWAEGPSRQLQGPRHQLSAPSRGLSQKDLPVYFIYLLMEKPTAVLPGAWKNRLSPHCLGVRSLTKWSSAF